MKFATLLFGLALVTGTADPPDDGGRFRSGLERGDGIDVGYTREAVRSMASAYPAGSSGENPTSWYEYVAVIDCIPPNSPTQPRLEICGDAVNYCEANVPDSSGPRSIIYRRTAPEDDPAAGWAPIGSTCHTDSVPPRSGEPAEELTEAMIIEQFHRTDFALPQAVIQPPDGTTLVNLPVYFELAWPDAGFAPAEIDTTTLAGHEVRIRPTLVGATYVTGDGARIGPTTSLGGGYPDGDITHTYTAAVEVAPYISVEYGGEVSVDGAAWTAIPSTAVIDGPTVPLQVLESRNRVFDN